jgi:diacylglycerol kinase (ATP)
MSDRQKYHIVINPASAGGRTVALTEKILRTLERYIGRTYSLCVTAAPLDAMHSVSGAIMSGYTNILVVGGDGTINEAVNGVLSCGGEETRPVSLGVISSGTGQGLALSLGLPQSIDEQVHCGLFGEPMAIDAAKLTYRDSQGSSCSRHFINECQVGFGAEVVRQTTASLKRAGRLAYGVRTLSLLFSQKAKRIVLSIDRQREITSEVLGVAIGNGAITAGGIRLTPAALLNDGLLDILIIHQQHVINRMRGFCSIPAGRHVQIPTFGYLRGASVRIESHEPVGISADGEFLGFTPCSIEMEHHAVHIRSTVMTQENHNAAHRTQTEAVGI